MKWVNISKTYHVELQTTALERSLPVINGYGNYFSSLPVKTARRQASVFTVYRLIMSYVYFRLHTNYDNWAGLSDKAFGVYLAQRIQLNSAW